MPTINLPDGNTAEMRDADDLRRSDIRAALKAADAEGINVLAGGMGLLAIATIQEALVWRFTRRWSLVNGDGTTPLPITLETVRDLPLGVFNPLGAYVQPLLQTVLGGDAGEPVDPTSAAPSSTPASSG
jgi:hypothetical protein